MPQAAIVLLKVLVTIISPAGSYLNINYSIIWYWKCTLQSPWCVSSLWFCASLSSNWLEVNDHQVSISTRCIGLLFTARLVDDWKLFS